MPPIEVGSAQRVGAIESRLARVTGGDTTTTVAKATTSSTVSAAPSIETSQALAAGKAPVDTDRVALIRQAVESGTYPLVPAKIADAMIAAGMLLRTGH
ncbi:flagellar biosynthesis anti-sigma factor FlgM [Novosphingobium resinovorum]|uniref:flagellar biosynthesis anti-sigma factor FlgM n=1 Tax=Novosphingobium resinovorum TaxID=158500 RepID=UPI002ED1579A|nr:flagellar biosynthesis anti-sigma factor FlgM [Novosphingobium resinovorum]